MTHVFSALLKEHFSFQDLVPKREAATFEGARALSYFSPPEDGAESVQRCGVRVVPHPWVGLKEPRLRS